VVVRQVVAVMLWMLWVFASRRRKRVLIGGESSTMCHMWCTVTLKVLIGQPVEVAPGADQ
jgi:hypothetical protein